VRVEQYVRCVNKLRQTNAKRQNDVILLHHKQRISSYIDHHTPLHCSTPESVSGAYNQAVVPGITRPLQVTDHTSLKKCPWKNFKWSGNPTAIRSEL